MMQINMDTEISPEVLLISQGLAKNSKTAILALSVQAQVYSQKMVQIFHFSNWAMSIMVCLHQGLKDL